MSTEDDKKAVEEAQRIMESTDPDDQYFTFTIPFESAMEIGMRLDFPRRSKKDLSGEKRAIEDLGRILLGDPVLRTSLDDPDSLLDPHVRGGGELDDTPEEETLLYMLADKFPTLPQLEGSVGEGPFKSRPSHQVSLNYKEVDALGHLVLRSLALAAEDLPPQNTYFREINIAFFNAFSDIQQGFINAGGRENSQLTEALHKFEK